MPDEFRSIRKFYFRTLTSSSRVYALIDPTPIPVMRKKRSKTITMDTLPGLLNGNVVSGRTIYVNMGGGYASTFEMTFILTDSTFISFFENRLSDMNDFYMGYRTNPFEGSGTDSMEEYRVNFSGENGLVIEQPDNYTLVVKLNLINLGLYRTFTESSSV